METSVNNLRPSDVTDLPAPGTAAEFAARHGLRRVGARPGPIRYLRQLWERRHFTMALARSRFIARNQQDRLGMLWNVLSPLIQAAVYATVFGILFTSRPDNWPAYVVSGVFIFTFSSRAITEGAKAVTGNAGLVRAVHFPRAVLPITTTLIQLFRMLPVIAVLFVIVAATGEPITRSWLLVIPALAVQAVFNLGVAFFTARITTHIPDFTQLLPFVMRIFFYTSAIFYEITRFPESVRPIVELSPIYTYIALVRQAVLGDFTPHAFTWYVGGAWAVLALVVGYFFFWQAEERYGRE
ncbi:MAG: ABC transporter permease [Streptosporangiales bacterium]|nr:ABC transporter permease [Streptosporangiales bacterium]